MKSFKEFRATKTMEVTYDTPISEVMSFYGIPYESNVQKSPLNESIDSTRYSIEVNYRTNIKEALKAYAKIVLGFASAALKKFGFHVKHVYDQDPVRIIVSSRKWDDGEWVGLISWNEKQSCFVISKGFYNKARRTVSIQSSQKCAGDSASELARDLRNAMHSVKDKPDRHLEKLKPIPMKRGPKK